MGTVVAIESDGGVAIAGDTSAVTDGTVRSESVDRLFEFDSMGAGAVGDPGAIQEFGRELDAELRHRELEAGSAGIEELARIAERQARSAGVDAVVAARDDEGIARLREIGAERGVLSTSTAAIGSGAPVALGQLEAVQSGLDLDEAATKVRDIVRAVAERDAETGGDVEVWTLASDDREGSDTDGG